MPEYTVYFGRSARRELERLPPQIGDRIFRKIEPLAVDPRPPGCSKLAGSGELWRIRVGNYRVVYAIDDERLIGDIIIVRHRSDAYRKR